MNIEKIKNQIKLGLAVEVISASLKQYYLEEDISQWMQDRIAEYNALGYWIEVALEDETTEFQLQDGKPTFYEWLKETIIIVEAVDAIYDGEVLVSEAVLEETALLREFVAKDTYSLDVAGYLQDNGYYSDMATKEKNDSLDTLVITHNTVAYDANIMISPGCGTTDEEGNLIEERARWAAKAMVKMIEITCKYAGII